MRVYELKKMVPILYGSMLYFTIDLYLIQFLHTHILYILVKLCVYIK